MEVWSIFQASDGLIWFSSIKGVFSFDGYDFHEPVDTSVYEGREAFFPAEDPQGRIWFSRIDKTLWYIENDTVRAWKHNHVLDDIRGLFFLVNQMAFDTNGDTWLHADKMGFIVVDSSGKRREIRYSENNNLLYGHIGDQILCGYQAARQPRPGMDNPDLDFLLLEQHKASFAGAIKLKPESELSLFFSSGRHHGTTYLKCGEGIYVCDAGVCKLFHKTDIPKSRISVSAGGEFVITCEDVEKAGLYYCPSPESVRDKTCRNILPGVRTHYAWFDTDGGLWVSTLGEGIFYCRDPGVDIYDLSPQSAAKDVFVLAFDGNRSIYAGVKTQAVQFDIVSGMTKIISTSSLVERWTSLYYNREKDELWAGTPLQVYRNHAWKPILNNSLPAERLGRLNAKTIIPSPDGSRLWMSSTFGFYELDVDASRVYYHKGDSLPEQNTRTYDVLEDNTGRIWVATLRGLQCWKNDKYEPPPLQHESLKFDASSLLMLSDGSIAIGTLGGGILIYHDEKPLQRLSHEGGLTSDKITRLRPGRDSTFLACTEAGLNRIRMDHHGKYQIRKVTELHGLPSELVYDAVEAGDELWIATDKGLVHWRGDTEPIHIPPPVLTGIWVNNQEVRPKKKMVFTRDQNHIEFAFHATSLRSGGKIKYRYRLMESDTVFSMTTSRKVNYSELASGHYTFQVQSQDGDGTWSKPVAKEFTILPPWWRSWWFISISIIMLGAGIFFVIRQRARTFKKKTEASLRMKELELAALRAQINPHFIFNCLGSIQQYIASNDPESASRYLARFAKLVRLSLHSSVDGKHSLADEISMLDNYLALEQMRFKGKFSYNIHVPEGMDPDNVILHPMLLQPFVENAVLHGVKGAKGEGRITIEFSQTDNSLRIVIADNGPGILEGQTESSNAHKSFGMSLTHRRLDLMAGGKGAAVISKQNRFDLEGQVAGFEVTVGIPIE